VGADWLQPTRVNERRSLEFVLDMPALRMISLQREFERFARG
jgi:hypothetical protein